MIANPGLRQTCEELAGALAATLDPWWIIGSAAVAILGAEAGVVRDVDVLLSVRDAQELGGRRDIVVQPIVPDPMFRSAMFMHWQGLPLPVELMADLHVAGRRLAPLTRQSCDTATGPIYVPEPAEMVLILRGFGRPKDIVRADALEAASPILEVSALRLGSHP